MCAISADRDAALSIAREYQLDTAFLLTTTTERFFPKLGFEQMSRDEIPTSVQSSVRFRSACTASATVMRKRMTLATATAFRIVQTHPC